MPAQEGSHRLQKAVLWEKGGYDAYGQPTVSEPVEIDVRWITGRSEALDPQGNTIALDARAHVGQVIAIGSTMWLGELADWLGTGSGGDDSEVHVVRTFSETPDLKGRNVRRTVGLMHFRDAPPEVE